MVGAIDFPALIRELHSELSHAQNGDRWLSHANEVVRSKLHAPFEFLE